MKLTRAENNLALYHRGESMKSTEVQALREILLAEKSALINESLKNLFTEEVSVEVRGDSADKVASEQNQDLEVKFKERQRLKVQEIDGALARIANASFGECLSCSEPIGLKRLQARPTAKYCIDCMENLDQRNTKYI